MSTRDGDGRSVYILYCSCMVLVRVTVSRVSLQLYYVVVTIVRVVCGMADQVMKMMRTAVC